MTSIRRFLLLWLFGAVISAGLILAAGYYWFALDEINEVSDRQLKQLARTVLAVHAARYDDAFQAAAPLMEKSHHGFATQIWSTDGTLLFGSVSSPTLPLQTTAGFQTLEVAQAKWRIVTLRTPQWIVQTGQSLSSRSALATELASKLLFPGLAAVMFMAAILGYGLKRGLQPLTDATAAVARRSVPTLEEIPLQNRPLEIQPLIKAINTLMGQLSDALTKQRQFTADAAHGLRTPLTALHLQFELLEASLDQPMQRDLAYDIRGGLERAAHMVAQLLDLSRVEPASLNCQPVVFDLAALARRAVGDFSLRAEQACLDLGADADQLVLMTGDPQQLRLLIDNLIDNAVRYTDPGGRIDVRVWHDPASQQCCLDVIDSAPGMSGEQRARAFDRFYRAPSRVDDKKAIAGAGLGLSIAKEVAARHHATIELLDGLPTANQGSGLMVRVRFRSD